MINKIKKISVVILPIILVILVIYSTVFACVGYRSGIGLKNFSPMYLYEKVSEIRKFESIKNIVKDNYVDKVNEEKLLNAAYEGYIEALEDRYSSYFTKEELESYLMRRKGAFGGIGLTVSTDFEKNEMIVTDFSENSPAQNAGVKIGDKIVGADGISIEDGVNQLFNEIIGEVGSMVKIKVYRDKIDEYLTFNIEREEIYQVNVRSEVYEDIGYIQIIKFTKGVYEDFKEQYEEITENNEISGLIIDLRRNGGGNLSDVVDIADFLLPETEIVYMLDQDGNKKVYTSDSKSIDLDIAVLIDEYSASASELLAGTIKDNKAGIIVGERSFGKGIVQTDYYLVDGSGLKITTKTYYMPSGYKIHKNGIEPDYFSKLDEKYHDIGIRDIPYDEDKPLKYAIDKLKEGVNR